MTTKTVNLYQFAELNDKAKERAREWWRECESQEFGGHGDLYESAETAAKLLGISFKSHATRLMSGKDRHESNIWWELDGQGQGASFEGSYSYAKGSVKAVAAEFPTDVELNRIAVELFKLQKDNKYGLSCTVSADGREAHKYGMSVECDAKESELLELMRDFADWIFKGIRAEFDWRMSDKSVDDSITGNDYTFTAEGKRED